ncbi:ABC-type glycerol-3-phosphate transport system, substrate-binding protein [Paenibacillaceae bacterium GAS479]|nr:ABC-type glycerol-3-phosphate transport system, substrate-binding protein [Paenibacillaceae bacterium GAS479]
MRQKLGSISALLLCFCLLLGCSNTAEQDEHTETASISVLYYDESSFFQMYGDLIRAEFPNLTLVVIPTKGLDTNQVEELMEQKQPDLMVIDNLGLFSRLINDGKLTSLELESDESFKFAEINPIIIDSLKEVGNGKLYGLAPFFNSRALFYNKKLFDDSGVDYPKDGMTWPEALQLSSRFSEAKDSYGLDPWSSEIDFTLNVVGKTANLSIMQEQRLEVHLNTKEWRDVFELTTEAFKSGTIYEAENGASKPNISLEELINGDMFLSGKAAIAYRSPNFMAQLEGTDVEWGVVSEPISELNPSRASGMSFNEIIAVNNRTENKDLVMKVFKYMNGSEMTRIRSRQLLGLPARTLETYGGRDISSLYRLKPNLVIGDQSNIPVEFWDEFYMKSNELLALVRQDQISVEEMLMQLQSWTEQTIRVYVRSGKIKS